MKQLLCSMALVLALGCLGNAQENTARSRRQGSATSPLKGTIHMTLEATDGPRDLEDMIEKAPLVLQGTVTLELPSRCLTPERKPCLSLETDFEVSVTKVFKYQEPILKLPSIKLDKVIVGQSGGKTEDYEVVADGDLPLETGVEYILFLTYDARPDLLRYEGYRWQVVGIWDGKFAVRDNKIRVAKSSIFQRSLNGSPNLPGLVFEDTDVSFLASSIERHLRK